MHPQFEIGDLQEHPSEWGRGDAHITNIHWWENYAVGWEGGCFQEHELLTVGGRGYLAPDYDSRDSPWSTPIYILKPL